VTGPAALTHGAIGNFPQAYTHVGLIHAAIGELLEARHGHFRAWSPWH
jgi:hypothetical protein